MGSFCDFRNKLLDNHAAVKNVNSLCVVFDSFVDAIRQDLKRAMFLEALKFIVPMGRVAASALGRQIPWEFVQHSRQKIKWLLTPMDGSVVYKTKAAKPAAKKRKFPVENTAVPNVSAGAGNKNTRCGEQSGGGQSGFEIEN